MGTSYSRSYSPSSVFGAGPAGTDSESIRDRIHALNESIKKQLEEADWRYMELYKCHERDKQQWSQQIQSMEQRMTTLYSFYEQMRSHSLHHLCPHLYHGSLLHIVTHSKSEMMMTTTIFRILIMNNIHRF